MTQHLDMLRCIAGQTRIPIVADIDTGFGNAVNVSHAVQEYERAGAAAVVIEDKTFPKFTSLAADARQELVRSEEFQGKIAAAIAARASADFMIIARTEALIAGLGEAEALARARAYEAAGADMILVHSKSRSADEIESFVYAWDGGVPIVLIPTSYPEPPAGKLRALGKVRVIIHGNHAIRASVAAMQATFARIVREQNAEGASSAIASVEEIFRLQRMNAIQALERRFLR